MCILSLVKRIIMLLFDILFVSLHYIHPTLSPYYSDTRLMSILIQYKEQRISLIFLGK